MDTTAARASRPLGAQVALLAWRRTALRLGVLSVVAARFLADSAGVAAVALGAAGIAVAVTVHASSNRAYRRAHDHGVSAWRRNTLLAGFVALAGASSLWWVLVPG